MTTENPLAFVAFIVICHLISFIFNYRIALDVARTLLSMPLLHIHMEAYNTPPFSIVLENLGTSPVRISRVQLCKVSGGPPEDITHKHLGTLFGSFCQENNLSPKVEVTDNLAGDVSMYAIAGGGTKTLLHIDQDSVDAGPITLQDFISFANAYEILVDITLYAVRFGTWKKTTFQCNLALNGAYAKDPVWLKEEVLQTVGGN